MSFTHSSLKLECSIASWTSATPYSIIFLLVFADTYLNFLLIFSIFFSDVELSLERGVYLYLGYSQKDESLLKKVTSQGALEAIGAIQGLVSYHNVNSNKVWFSTLFVHYIIHISINSR